MRRLLLLLLVVPLLPALVAPSPAYACSCATTIQGAIDGADVVVVGRVETKVAQGVGKHGSDDVVRLDVQQVLKGVATRTLDVVSHGCNGPALSPGMRGVIFLQREGDDLAAHLCGGSGFYSPAEVTAALGTGHEPTEGSTQIRREGADLALPLALGAGGSLVLLVGLLWLRFKAN
ncbi:MAG TPA: hypothetical protein VLI04_08665 [Nocardioidaceae bacterium]|nr:hypothetical protein [Nocardioidaceae bacterium]